ncbi:SPOR domain-containing protein [Novilysobacter erysipheiresistens]|uniref:SPOR domain-containing protein n=1 Tax=Novilysobacter erysipheiresistens TaxID=1749332 RepID=A0ABU7YYH0_9GAMM
MAARRGKTQARRNAGNNGLPGWAWMVLGIILTIVAVLFAPKILKSDGDGFFRPQPNPDARPAPVSGVDDEPVAPRAPAADERSADAADETADPEFDFYTLLPGKEVPISDAELAATERAEAARLAQIKRASEQAEADRALPQPVGIAPAERPLASAPITDRDSATAAGAGNGKRYLLQAGAFGAAAQAEELKARIALLGLSARVEPATINGDTVHRVRMGPYGTASDLADAKRKLERGGLPAMAIEVK